MNTVSNSNNNEKALEVRTHDIPIADAMSEFMKQGWAPSPLSGVTSHPSVPYTKLRREKLSKKLKLPFFDADDFHRGQSDSGSLGFHQSSLIENYWMPKAKLITVASPFIAKKYSKLIGLESLVINNVFNFKNIPVIKRSITNPIKLFWFSQTVGKGRGLEDVLTALKKFPFESFSITIMGDLSSEMENYLRGLVLEKNEIKVDLNFLRPVDPDKIFEIAS